MRWWLLPRKNSDRLLKKAHLLRYPAASPSRRRGKKSLLIRRDATPHPSPCQGRDRLAAGAAVGNDFKPFLTKDSEALYLGIFEHPY